MMSSADRNCRFYPLVEEMAKHLWCYCGLEKVANLEHEVTHQPAGASQKEMLDIKLNIERSRNNAIFENFKQRNVRE